MRASRAEEAAPALGRKDTPLSRLFVPIRVIEEVSGDGGSHESRAWSGPGVPAVMSELLVSWGSSSSAGGGNSRGSQQSSSSQDAAAAATGAARAAPAAARAAAWDPQEGTNVLVVPGNPGVVQFYEDYLRALRASLGPQVNAIVCICHAAHTQAPPASPAPYLYSLQQQVQHKVEFLLHAAEYLNAASESIPTAQGEQGRWWELPPHTLGLQQQQESRAGSTAATPADGQGDDAASRDRTGKWILIGHSIGAHICLEIQKHFTQGGHTVTVTMAKLGGISPRNEGALPLFPVLGLYPFLSLNRASLEQRTLGLLAHVTPLCVLVACLVQVLRSLLPPGGMQSLLNAVLGKRWTPTAIKATGDCLLQYHVLRNFAYMGMTEFDYFARYNLDWEWLQRHPKTCVMVFGRDDHWGPLTLSKDMRTRLPAVRVVEDEDGHPHAFGCTAAGSEGVARTTVELMAEWLPPLNSSSSREQSNLVQAPF